MLVICLNNQAIPVLHKETMCISGVFSIFHSYLCCLSHRETQKLSFRRKNTESNKKMLISFLMLIQFLSDVQCKLVCFQLMLFVGLCYISGHSVKWRQAIKQVNILIFFQTYIRYKLLIDANLTMSLTEKLCFIQDFFHSVIWLVERLFAIIKLLYRETIQTHEVLHSQLYWGFLIQYGDQKREGDLNQACVYSGGMILSAAGDTRTRINNVSENI